MTEILIVLIHMIGCGTFCSLYNGLSCSEQAVFSSCFTAALICSLLLMMKRRIRIFLGGLMIFLASTLTMAQCWYYIYFSSFISLRQCSLLSEAFGVRSEAMGKFDYALFLLYVPLVLYIFVLWRNRNVPQKELPFHKMVLYYTAMCSICCLLAGNSKYSAGDKEPGSDSYLYHTLYNRVKAMETFGLYAYTWKDMMTLEERVETEENEIEDYLEQYGYHHEDNSYTGMLKGKNLILIMCESLSSSVISKELTPTLYKMQQEGISFNNHYAPVYQTHTADSEFISLTSQLPSVDYGSIPYTFYENSFPEAMPAVFLENGYETSSFHSYYGTFYNRNELHKQLGFDHSYFAEDMAFEKDSLWQDAINWVLDEDLFEQMVQVTKTSVSEPYFNYVITASGHMPYVLSRLEMEHNNWQVIRRYGQPGEKYTEEEICYLGSANALDDALEQLLSDLRRSHQLDDTVIVLYGDHYPFGLSDEGISHLIGDMEHSYEMNKVPFIIYAADIEPQSITKTTSTYDIYPTLANLFDISLEGRYITGVDALSSQESTVIFEDRSWLSDSAYYDSGTVSYEKFGAVTDIYINQKNEWINQLFDVGQKILLNNYYAKETDEVEE